MRRRHSIDSEEQNHGGGSHGRYKREYNGEHLRKQSTYEGRSDRDDGRWKWEDSPHWDSHSNTSRHHQPSPSPNFLGASPDVGFVSPWLGGHTPHSGPGASPWNTVSPSLVPIRASGSSSSRCGGMSQQSTFSAENSRPSEDGETDKSYYSKDNNTEITESMHLEMEYNSDRAWYDREEGNTMFDVASSSFFLGDEASFQKKEAELTKRLV